MRASAARDGYPESLAHCSRGHLGTLVQQYRRCCACGRVRARRICAGMRAWRASLIRRYQRACVARATT
ncbi:hypothetical protein WJ87_07355 [Burkholderia ubonensis]|nr:hypothetical protein WJ87_07355 [Burkholderia ubonensis]